MPTHVQDRSVQTCFRPRSFPFDSPGLFVLLLLWLLRHLFDPQVLKHQHFHALHQRFACMVVKVFTNIRDLLGCTAHPPLFPVSPFGAECSPCHRFLQSSFFLLLSRERTLLFGREIVALCGGMGRDVYTAVYGLDESVQFFRCFRVQTLEVLLLRQ